MRMQLPIQTYRLRSRQSSTSRLVNCFAEQLPPDAKTPVVLNRGYGITAWTTVGTGPILAMLPAHSVLYVVSNDELYEVSTSGTATLLGNIGGPNVIDIDANTTTAVVVNQPNAYYYDSTTSTFAQITDTDFTSRGAGDVEFVDTYLLFREPSSGRFFGSDASDATSYDALNFATGEGGIDDLVGMKVDHRQVLLFGTNSLEMWENTGASGFPFERSINGYIEMGCLAGQTVAKLDHSVYWLASDGTVRRLEGLTPTRVSTHAIEQSISEATASTGKAFTYTQDGHLFYVLSFSDRCLVFDVSTNLWHERSSYGYSTWRPKTHAHFSNKHLVGDSTSNKIGYLDPAAYDEWGDTQRMEWTYQPIYAEGRRAFHDRLEMQFESGTGSTTDPQVMLEYSDDGGKTWRFMPNKTLGKVGEYENRTVWHALGSARERVYRGSVADAFQATLTDTFIEVRGGRL